MVNVEVETLSGTDHPVCAFIRRLRSIFLMAQPPLLSEEGNTLSCNSFTPPRLRRVRWLRAILLIGAATPPVPGGEHPASRSSLTQEKRSPKDRVLHFVSLCFHATSQQFRNAVLFLSNR